MDKRFGSLFIKFFMPYLLIIIIFFGLSSIAYFAAFNEIKANAVKMQEAYIAQSTAFIDGWIKEVIDVSTQIGQIPLVRAFSTRTDADLEKNYFMAVKLLNQINSTRIVTESVQRFYVFYRNSMRVLNNSSLVKYSKFYSNSFSMDGYDSQQFSDTIFGSYYSGDSLAATTVKDSDITMYSIPILSTLGYNFNNPDIVVMLLVDANKLKKAMVSINKDTGGNFYILNKDGSIVMSLYEDNTINNNGFIDRTVVNDDYMVFTTSSNTNEWSYVLIQHKGEVFKEINRLRSSANILIGIIFLIGILTSLIATRHNSKPVQLLINNQNLLIERLQAQRPFMIQAFLERWLTGNYQDENEIKNLSLNLRVDYIGKYYCVAVINYCEYTNVFGDLNEGKISELKVKGLVVKDVLLKNGIQEAYIHDIEHGKLAVVLIGNQESNEEFYKYIINKIADMRLEFKVQQIKDIIFGVGNIYEEIKGVTLSLKDAIDALLTYDIKGIHDVIWYSELPPQSETYYYPTEVEGRLYNCTRAGEKKQAENILREILQVNIFEKNLSVDILQLFIYDIWGTIAKIQARFSSMSSVNKVIKNAIDKLEGLNDYEKIQHFRKTILDVCDLITIEKQNKHQGIMESINEYIQVNFINPDFGLPMISDKFNLSEAYISQIFKEFNDENFINYLQNLRMNRAEQLLKETHMPIKDIVVKSGYNSNNTFGKAFRRIHGVSASEFREKYVEVEAGK